MDTVALIIGYVVMGAAALVVSLAVLSLSGMALLMLVTKRARRHPSGRRQPFFGAGIWPQRHSRWLRTLLRQHGKIHGEREDIAAMGIGSFLWGDGYRLPSERRADPR